jgi:hypothetical protein
VPFVLTTVSIYLHDGQAALAGLAMGGAIIASDSIRARTHAVEAILDSFAFVIFLCPIAQT